MGGGYEGDARVCVWGWMHKVSGRGCVRDARRCWGGDAQEEGQALRIGACPGCSPLLEE